MVIYPPLENDMRMIDFGSMVGYNGQMFPWNNISKCENVYITLASVAELVKAPDSSIHT